MLKKEKDTLIYEYDFGDSWEHKILLEKILTDDGKTVLPVCIKGKRASPPEDCGGIWGYEELLETISNPKHPDYNDMLEWLGGEFDHEADIPHPLESFFVFYNLLILKYFDCHPNRWP
ncbi:MAG: plasmid pRiA4b ORF-3 family protein [Methylococcaceae bacterium]